MSDRVTRVILVVLAVPSLFGGAWAVVAPESWYDNFPGWSPRLVAALPPYNEHLATDAGSGLLATGGIALLAAVWLRRDAIVVAMTAYLIFGIPHAVFHTSNPAAALSASQDATSAITLWFGVVLASAVLATTVRKATT